MVAEEEVRRNNVWENNNNIGLQTEGNMWERNAGVP